MADQYVLRVTAGSSYNMDEQQEIKINTSEPLKISNEHMDIELNVRVQDYRGLPRDSPKTSPYFDTPPHNRNGDQYSISFRFTPKKPSGENSTEKAEEDADSEEEVEGISGVDLQFGNDFDHPIRDRLPPGFGTALNIVKWWIDPGLEGDPYSDTPYLYGPALSSFNAIHVGASSVPVDESVGGLFFTEGGDESGMEKRHSFGMPDDTKARMKWALSDDTKKAWRWEYGTTYGVDFFNPYVDFNGFALRLPGFHLPIIRYWDGQGLRPNQKRSHTLRYVLRNKTTSELYLVILFSLYLKEDVNEDGSIKPEALKAAAKASGGTEHGTKLDSHDEQAEFDEEKALDEARRKLSGVHVDLEKDPSIGQDTSADDVD